MITCYSNAMGKEVANLIAFVYLFVIDFENNLITVTRKTHRWRIQKIVVVMSTQQEADE